MTQRKPTEELEREHLTIQKVVGAMEVLINRLEAGKDAEAAVLIDVSEFLQTFADKFHHGKEESYLFKLLEKKGVPLGGCTLEALLQDHEKCRSLLADLKTSSERYIRTPGTGREALVGVFRSLIELYTTHIWKEDFLLFPMADKILSDSEQKELSAKFSWHESEIGVDVHHAYEQLAGRILEVVCRETSTCDAD